MTTDLANLPPIYAEVLGALTLPDPAPQETLDSPAYAVVRRLPHTTIAQAATALDGLNGLGLIRVKYLLGPVSPLRTANTREWITEGGWRELGWRPFWTSTSITERRSRCWSAGEAAGQ